MAIPAKLILEHAKRIKYVHLKDFRREPFAFLPLGEGELDMNAILQALVTIKYTGWIAVELDAYDDPKTGAEISMRYLTEFEKPSRKLMSESSRSPSTPKSTHHKPMKRLNSLRAGRRRGRAQLGDS